MKIVITKKQAIKILHKYGIKNVPTENGNTPIEEMQMPFFKEYFKTFLKD